MDLYHQPVLGRVVDAAGIEVLHRVSDICHRSLHHEDTLGIVAARSTDGVYKDILVFDQPICELLEISVGRTPLVSQHQRAFGIRACTTHARLVESGKDHPLVIVLERIGDVGPQFSELFLLCADISFRGETVVLQPAAVPMVVDDDIESGVDTVVDDLLDTAHPRRIDGHRRLVSNMSHHPRTGDAHAVEAIRLDGIKDLLRGLGRLPRRFGGYTGDGCEIVVIASGLQRVAEVPSRSHIVCHLRGGEIHRLHAGMILGKGSGERACKEQGEIEFLHTDQIKLSYYKYMNGLATIDNAPVHSILFIF